MDYSILQTGISRPFSKDHPLIANGSSSTDALVIVGSEAAIAFKTIRDRAAKIVVLVELDKECLGTLTGESRGLEGSNILGFARFRLGDGEPSNLVELVRQPKTLQTAIDAAQEIFAAAGLQVSICNDFAGRIIDRLVRPYYNAALRRLDEGLASADDLDTTLKLGLGYPEGPIALLERTGLHHHFDVSQALFEVYGEAVYAPARRAHIAKLRQGK
jgi:3-hydroxybutyryl-CoA dehydrogenase